MKRKHKPDSERPGRPWEHPYLEGPPRTLESYHQDVKRQGTPGQPMIPTKLNPKTLWSSLSNIKYPTLATPKVAGVRCLTLSDGHPVDVDYDDIPNRYIREQLSLYGVGGLDGVLTITGELDQAVVEAAVNDLEATPTFEFHVFDLWALQTEEYHKRADIITSILPMPRPHMIRVLSPVIVYDMDGLVKYWDTCVDRGYDGVVIRDPGAPYVRTGRPAECGSLDELSAHEMGTGTIVIAKGEGNLDAFVVKDAAGNEFDVACGYTQEQRDFYWKTRKQHVGYDLTFRYNPGAKVPRNPVFIKTTAR